MNYLRHLDAKFKPRCTELARFTPTLLLVLMLSGLSGCASDGQLKSYSKTLDLAQLQAGQALKMGTAADHASKLEWWQSFNDPQLNQLMAMLGENAPSIQIAQARLDRAMSMTDLSRADRQIDVTATGSMTADRYPDHYTYPDTYAGKTGSSGSILGSMRWHLDLWGKWKALEDSARFNTHAAGLQMDDARIILESAIASSYVQWHAAEQQLQNQRQQRNILQRLIEIEQQKRRAGLTEHSRVIQVQLNLTALDAQLPLTLHQIQRQKHAIAALLGQTPAFSAHLTPPQLKLQADIANVSTLPLAWVGRRPDVAAGRQMVLAHERATDAARTSFYPDVDLTAMVGLQSLGLDHLLKAGSRSMVIGPALNLPLFEQNRLRARLRGEIADYDLAVAQYNQSLINAIQNVVDDLDQVQTATQQRQIVRSSLQHSQQLHRIKTQLIHKGLATQQAGLTAELNQMDRAAALIQADQSVALAQIALTRSLGGQWAFSNNRIKVKQHD
ncbi:NodT family efflux transporter outer membrane factor (OMF) lipoprotein [Acinetobacter calcoaceticus]|uniref:NodT family efflux transporter outer membrane factor (OMF) lipoprotein n=1 Tax=Acinetobacter calcoaceticus TaxID=471 RepID=A0A4R1Y102_ACICA|nr:NodT family efflux transporter outer membrane factor (OMF) lipoprotein [Acinetobacter calcoaceticus]